MWRPAVACVSIVLVLASGTTLTAKDDALTTGTFRPAGTLADGRAYHSATALADGGVLVVGGVGFDDSLEEPKALASAEVWDPATGTFSATGTLAAERMYHSATALPDGRVLVVVGLGESESVHPHLASAEVWDPATGTFGPTGPLATERVLHAATVLRDGRVLVVGGYGRDGFLASAEVWDPATGTFSATGSMLEPRQEPSASSLDDGRVLVVGGRGEGTDLASAEVWDPATGTFSATGSRAAGRRQHRAAVLPDGRVLTVGGWNDQGLGITYEEVWDPATDTFSATGSLAEERVLHTATALPDGRVLAVGGHNDYSTPVAAEIWDAATGTFGPTGPMAVERAIHTATALPDGRVLVVGGFNEGPFGRLDHRPLTSAEVWGSGDG